MGGGRAALIGHVTGHVTGCIPLQVQKFPSTELMVEHVEKLCKKVRCICMYMYCIYMFLMRDERKKQARSNRQTRQSNTAHPRQSLFLEKNELTQVGLEPTTLYPHVHVHVVCIHTCMYIHVYLYTCTCRCTRKWWTYLTTRMW